MTSCIFRGGRSFRMAGAVFVMAALALVANQAGAQIVGGGKTESQVKLSASAGKIDKDGQQIITIKMEINPEWHAYANPVKNEDLEPVQTVVKITGAKKLDRVDFDYPKGKLGKTEMQTYMVYDGTVEIKATVKRAAGDTGPLEVTVNYTTCNDKKGICLPP